MKLKMFEVLDISQFYQLIRTFKLPIKTTYKLSKLSNLVDKETSFYQEEFKKIIEEYGQKDDDGNLVLTEDKNSVKILPDKDKEAQKKIQDLMNLDVEIETAIEFNIEDFGNIELSLDSLLPMMPFIKE